MLLLGLTRQTNLEVVLVGVLGIDIEVSTSITLSRNVHVPTLLLGLGGRVSVLWATSLCLARVLVVQRVLKSNSAKSAATAGRASRRGLCLALLSVPVCRRCEDCT